MISNFTCYFFLTRQIVNWRRETQLENRIELSDSRNRNKWRVALKQGWQKRKKESFPMVNRYRYHIIELSHTEHINRASRTTDSGWDGRFCRPLASQLNPVQTQERSRCGSCGKTQSRHSGDRFAARPIVFGRIIYYSARSLFNTWS